MKKAIIFDFYGVIATDPLNFYLDTINATRDGEIDDLIINYDKGEIELSDFLVRLGKITKHPIGITTFRNFININQPLVELLRKLKNSYLLYILSNASSSIHEVINNNNLGDIFDEIYISSEMGLVKPDPKIFSAALKSVGLPSQELLFVDDNPKNVNGAGLSGIDSILFTKTTRLIEDLSSYGILV